MSGGGLRRRGHVTFFALLHVGRTFGLFHVELTGGLDVCCFQSLFPIACASDLSRTSSFMLCMLIWFPSPICKISTRERTSQLNVQESVTPAQVDGV